MYSKHITVNYLNSRSLSIDVNTNDYEVNQINKKTNDVQKILVNKTIVLEVGENVSVTHSGMDYKYKVNNILKNKEKKNNFFILQTQLTKSSQYILPYYFTNTSHVSWYNYLYNVYLEEDLSRICLIYRFSQDEEYKKIESNITKHPEFIKVKDFDNAFVCFELKVPDKLELDLCNFTKGKYSNLSTLLKAKILKFHNNSKPIYNVLYRSPIAIKELENKLDCKLPPNSEVKSIPDGTEYINYFINKEL